MRLILFTFLLMGGLTTGAPAQSTGSSADAPADSSNAASAEASWLLLPYVSYAPSTKIAAGGAAGYYLPDTPSQWPSSVELSFTVTQQRQVTAGLSSELYWNKGQWRIEGILQGGKYPNSFHGIGGDTPAAAEESYTSRYGRFDLIVQRRLFPNLRIGPRVFVRIGDITDPETNGLIENDQVTGASGGTTAGVGGTARWNARDNRYYPTTGTYAEAKATWYSTAWESDHTYGHLTTDLRAYRPVGIGVLAAQAYAEAIAGQAPFLLLPMLGGSSRMRGYRTGRFRDDILWSVQTEYRCPLFWRFKGTIFASAGEVAPRIGPSLFNEVEVAIGIGGRFRLTDGGLHGRLDVAYGRTGVEVYMSLGEAF